MCDHVFYKQSLLFLRPDTLEGKKLHLYVILKFLKFVSGADVTSFKVIITIPLVCVIFMIMLSSGEVGCG